MKYLFNYKLFLEAGDFDIKSTDLIDVKKSKEELNSLQGNIKEYNQIKPKIDQIFKSTKDNSKIETQITQLLGKDPKSRNPFLVTYLTIAQDQKSFDDLVDKISAEKISQGENNTLLSLSKDEDQKSKLTKQIELSKKNILTMTKNLNSLKINIGNNKKHIQKQIEDHKKSLESDIKNITQSRN